MIKRKQGNNTSDPEGAEGLSRREFLKAAGTITAGTMLAGTGIPAVAGPLYTPPPFLIPADKKLDPDWIRSLYLRGAPTSYSGPALARIGMPVGGLCAGTVYLGGDGRLWLWDIFNKNWRYDSDDGPGAGLRASGSAGELYASPLRPTSPLNQGFALQIGQGASKQTIPLDRRGFKSIRFQGQYPLGLVEFADEQVPVKASLRAFSPFIPLDYTNSSLPAICMQYTVTNTSTVEQTVGIGGWLENAIGCYTAAESIYAVNGFEGREDLAGTVDFPPDGIVQRRNEILQGKDLAILTCSARTLPRPPKTVRENPRPDIVYADFEGQRLEFWAADGHAFGFNFAKYDQRPDYQKVRGGVGKQFASSHFDDPQYQDAYIADADIGVLTGRSFLISRDYINLRIGGGASRDTRIELQCYAEPMRFFTGEDDSDMRRKCFDVRQLQGLEARILIVDRSLGKYGHINVDQIVFSDVPEEDEYRIEEKHDYGSMSLMLLNPPATGRGSADVNGEVLPGELPIIGAAPAQVEKHFSYEESLTGALATEFELQQGESRTVTFAITWHVPNLFLKKFGYQNLGREYATRFTSSAAVAEYLAANFEKLESLTMRWIRAWYGGSLPHWFLERTLIPASVLATETCYRFADGRFYGWAGIANGHGTPTDVWHYAQAAAFLFPELERNLREQVDFGVGFDATSGIVGARGEFEAPFSVEGQAGTILRSWREHRMSADDAFLRRNWSPVKKALKPLLKMDPGRSGILPDRMASASAMYLAALKAGQAMAQAMDDRSFAEELGLILNAGEKGMQELFNGEYFYQAADAGMPGAFFTGNGSYVNSVLGQGWAWLTGLGRLYDAQMNRSALRAIWKYNFAPDVGPYYREFRPARTLARAGEAGLITCTWPQQDVPEANNKSTERRLLNDCVTGFEYMGAAQMIREGMIEEGLAIIRAVHDRYGAGKRNPFNEMESGDHYASSMASFAVYLAACGFEYDGPEGFLAFSPKLSPAKFCGPFVAAESWGEISQEQDTGKQINRIEVLFGQLQLNKIAVDVPSGKEVARLEVDLGERRHETEFHQAGDRITIRFAEPLRVDSDETLTINVWTNR